MGYEDPTPFLPSKQLKVFKNVVAGGLYFGPMVPLAFFTPEEGQ